MEAEVSPFLESFPRFDRIYLTSEGGEEIAALALAEAVIANDAVVVVDGFCLSACALYPFVAASHVELSENSVVGVHPGALSVNAATEHLQIASADRDKLQAVSDRAVALYEARGRDTRVFLDAVPAHGVTCVVQNDAQSDWTVSLQAPIWLWIPDQSYWRSIGVEFSGELPSTVSEAETAILHYIERVPPFTFGGNFPTDITTYDFSNLTFCDD